MKVPDHWRSIIWHFCFVSKCEQQSGNNKSHHWVGFLCLLLLGWGLTTNAQAQNAIADKPAYPGIITLAPLPVPESGSILRTEYYDAAKTNVQKQYHVRSRNLTVLHGPYRAYYPDGAVQEDGQYVDGKPDGLWHHFFANGVLKMKLTYKGGQPASDVTYYFESGLIRSMGGLLNGQLNGQWTFYYENGKPKQSGNYANGKPCETWTYFYENGLRKALATYVGDTAFYREEYETGSLKAAGPLVNGKSEGVWRYYYPSGKLKAEGQETQGLKHGTWRYYHENDSLESTGEYQAGVQVGAWKYFHQNGRLNASGNMQAGQRQGAWQMFYETGEMQGEGEFTAGDGPFTTYYPSGKLKSKGALQQGKYHGEWVYYDEEGRTEGRCLYKDGEGEYTGYYPDGRKRITGTLSNGERTGTWQLFDPKGSLVGFYKAFDQTVSPPMPPVKSTPVARNDQPRMRSIARRSRHFIKVVNERKGFIVATNPLAVFFNGLPVSLEYHWKPRLGYELTGTWLRTPFFGDFDNAELNRDMAQGMSVSFRQKLYFNEDPSFGSFYWAQELRYTYLNHQLDVFTAGDSATGTPSVISRYAGPEQRLELSVLVGTRLYQELNRKTDITLDVFAGVGAGYRWHSLPTDPGIISSAGRQEWPVTLRLGLMLGVFYR